MSFSALLSVFYPLNCRCCETPLVKGETLYCLHCELNFGELFVADNPETELDQLFWGKAEVESTFAAFQFLKAENIQGLIHEFKYGGNKKLAFKMGQLLGRYFTLESSLVDCVSFVPMHSKKERKRGYNQAEILAKGFSKELNIPLCKVLERLKESDSQTDKDVYERFENMQEKFQITKFALGVKHVILIDDVITTGATLAACANVLISKGIRVSVVCLAYRGLVH